MSTLDVVVVVDPVLCLLLQVGNGRPGASVDQFLLVGGEERFADGIVVADPGAAKGASNMVFLTVLRELSRRILCSMPFS